MTALNKAKVWGSPGTLPRNCVPTGPAVVVVMGYKAWFPTWTRSTESSQSLWKKKSRTLQCKEKRAASDNAQRSNRWIFPKEGKAGSRREAAAPHADLQVQNRLSILGTGEEEKNLARGATWASIKCLYREVKVSHGHWGFLPAANKSPHLLT